MIFALKIQTHRLLGYRMLEARTGLLQKRQAPKGKGGKGGLDLGGLLSAFSQQSRPNSTAPVSTVAEIQDEAPKAWLSAKRRKVRYGPYRIPPTSVSTRSKPFQP
jgi:hypothetical protein